MCFSTLAREAAGLGCVPKGPADLRESHGNQKRALDSLPLQILGPPTLSLHCAGMAAADQHGGEGERGEERQFA